MNPLKALSIGTKVTKVLDKVRPALDTATSAMYLGSFLSQGKKEKQAKQEMIDEQRKADVKAVVTQRQSDLIDKL